MQRELRVLGLLGLRPEEHVQGGLSVDLPLDVVCDDDPGGVQSNSSGLAVKKLLRTHPPAHLRVDPRLVVLEAVEQRMALYPVALAKLGHAPVCCCRVRWHAFN